MDFVDHDDCCSPRLTKALRGGTLGDTWTCPKCGCTWLAVLDEETDLRRWSPEVFIAIL